ncbi:MAG: GIY-YIG nuclease family protein, partial [Gammaproteobacteria bacterium]|nr:GIY-YIG nuclease family protein [Gammaproteobacteria bacterium]
MDYAIRGQNLKPDFGSEWYVYIIRCSDTSLYTGITTDVERRFSEHA